MISYRLRLQPAEHRAVVDASFPAAGRDARIRRETRRERSLDDALRLAYARHSGERGFTPREFGQTVSDAAGFDLSGWLERAVASTAELDYDEALDLFGLRFHRGSWTLAGRRNATRA